MEGNKLVWILGLGAAGYLLYEYGVSQGWWSSLTGPSLPTTVLSAAQQQAFITQAQTQGLTTAQIQTLFTQIQTLATQCGAAYWNPSAGQCSGNGAGGPAALAPIAPPAPTTPTIGTGTPATVAPNPTGSPTLPIAAVPPAAPATPTPAGITAAQLIAAAGVSANATFDADQWNYYETQINPSVVTTDFSAQGWTRDASNTATNPGVTQMTAAQYITLRQSAGLSGFRGMRGLWDPTGYPQTVPMPYALVADDPDRFDYYSEAYGVN